MEWRPKVVGSSINLWPEFDQNLDERWMTLTCSQMQWREPVRISTINNLKQLVVLIELLFRIAEDSIDFVCVSPINFGPVVHFDLFNILLSLTLLARLLGKLWRVRFWTCGCTSNCVLLGLLLVEMSIAATVSRKFIGFFIIIISKIDLLVIFHITKRRLKIPLIWQIGLRGLLAAHSIMLFWGWEAGYLFALARKPLLLHPLVGRTWS